MHRKKDAEKKKRTYEGVNSAYFAKKWKSAFAGGMPADAVQKYVDAPGCYLWHAFTWGKAACLQREAASAAFDMAEKTGAFIAEEYSFNGGGKKIKYVFKRCPPDLKSADLADAAEVFVVGKNFRWTYVVTHETACGLGPYFAMKGERT